MNIEGISLMSVFNTLLCISGLNDGKDPLAFSAVCIYHAGVYLEVGEGCNLCTSGLCKKTFFHF